MHEVDSINYYRARKGLETAHGECGGCSGGGGGGGGARAIPADSVPSLIFITYLQIDSIVRVTMHNSAPTHYLQHNML